MEGKTITWDTKRAAEQAAESLADIKASDIVLIDVSQTSGFADYLIVATGDSNTHMRALSDKVRKAMSNEGASIQHAEGRESPNWILLDYSSVVINIFSRKAREYYALETLWGDSKIIHWDESSPTAHSVG